VPAAQDLRGGFDDPAAIRRILTHLELSLDPGEPAPGRAPPGEDDASA
jgi:hypothetical protein